MDAKQAVAVVVDFYNMATAPLNGAQWEQVRIAIIFLGGMVASGAEPSVIPAPEDANPVVKPD